MVDLSFRNPAHFAFSETAWVVKVDDWNVVFRVEGRVSVEVQIKERKSFR